LVERRTCTIGPSTRQNPIMSPNIDDELEGSATFGNP